MHSTFTLNSLCLPSRNAPGLWSPDQIASWKRIVDAVHAKGGYFFAQLRADGRAADPSYIRSLGHTFVAPSDIPIEEGDEKPTPLTKEKIERFVQLYAQAAKNAVEGSGFDGVEVCVPIRLCVDFSHLTNTSICS